MFGSTFFLFLWVGMGSVSYATINNPKYSFQNCHQSIRPKVHIGVPENKKNKILFHWESIDPQALFRGGLSPNSIENRFAAELRLKHSFHSTHHHDNVSGAKNGIVRGSGYHSGSGSGSGSEGSRGLLGVARQMGFEIEQDFARALLVDLELKNYFAKATLDELTEDLIGPHSVLTNNPLVKERVHEILRRPHISTDAKRELLIRWHQSALVKSGQPLMDLLRHRNGLEKKLGGRSVYDVAFFQNLLAYHENLFSFSKIAVPMDGLLYIPGVTSNSLLVYGHTDGSRSPLNFIQRANRHTPIRIHQVKIFERTAEIDSADNLIIPFAALIGPDPERSKTYPLLKYPSFVEEELDHLQEEEDFMVRPFYVSSDRLALIRSQKQCYVLYFEKGYRYPSRAEMNLSPQSQDIFEVFRCSLRDSGLEKESYELVEWPQGVFMLEFFNPVPEDSEGHFAYQLQNRVLELRDPVQARRSRESTHALGIPTKYAEGAEVSGFESVEEISKTFNLQTDLHEENDHHLPVNSLRQSLTENYWPQVELSSGGKATLILDDDIHVLGSWWTELGDFTFAHIQPMTPFLGRSEIYIVFSERHRNAGYRRIDEIFTLFKTREQADYFCRTHRFVDREIK